MNKLKQKEIIVEIMNEDAKDGLYKKQTAVEYLKNEIQRMQERPESDWQTGYQFALTQVLHLIDQVKEMEKQQIVDATCLNKYVNEDDREIGEQYYNEEYGGNK